MIFIVVMPSPFPTLAPCVLASADNSVFVDFILIMVSESGKQQQCCLNETSVTFMYGSRHHNDPLEMLLSVYVSSYASCPPFTDVEQGERVKVHS